MKTIYSDIRLIAFDLFGVLITEGHLISNGLLHLMPPDADKGNVKSNYEIFNLGEIKEKAFWINIGQPDNKFLRADFLNHFELDPEFKIIKQIKQDYNLAILSNCPQDWAAHLSNKFNFERDFKPIVFSGFEKCKKPNQAIYELLIERSNVEAKHIAFIDDRLENLETAQNLGMTTIYFKKEIEKNPFQPDFTISKMSEILNLFN